MKAKLTRILQLPLSEIALHRVRSLRTVIPNGARPLSDTNLHITLLKTNESDRKLITQELIDSVDWPSVDIEPFIRSVKRDLPSKPEMTGYPREAWYALIDALGQEQLRNATRAFAERAEIVLSSYEKSRPFHVSVANLSGSPMMSVGDISWDDVAQAEKVWPKSSG